MNSRVLRLAATLPLAGLALGGCATTGSAPEDHGTLHVVAGFYPLEWTAARVGGDRVEVISLTPPGAEAHDVELTPQDVAAVSDADLVIHLAGFQPAVDEAASAEAADRTWDAGEAADLGRTADEHTDEEHTEEEGHAAEGHTEEGHTEEGHTEEGHADEAQDPHFWLDPTRLADVGDALADRLAEADPDGAETYRAGAAALRGDLEALDAEMEEGLADCAVDTLVTSHDAFGYLGDRYGLEVVGISGLSPSQEPDAAASAEIADLVRERGVRTVYTETLVDPAVAQTVAEEAGVDTAVLDPVEGLTDESAGEDYLEVMRANLATLREGQNCS